MTTLYASTYADRSKTASGAPVRSKGERSTARFSAKRTGSRGRLGLHYFPDTLHYRDSDLQTWLPELQALGVSWLVLFSDMNRAIPEAFVSGLVKAGIEPIIQFRLPLDAPPVLNEIGTLLQAYARWGARYVIFHDRPNARASWSASNWVQQDLVERFLDRFLPVASLARSFDLIPVFPPLEPGGNYWDTAFLRSALEALQRRKQVDLLNHLVLSAYAWTGEKPLNWGAGGPERWPMTRPYRSTPGSEDQLGFRIFDWYEAIASSVLQRPCQILLLQAGVGSDPSTVQASSQAPSPFLSDDEICLRIARLLAGETVVDPLDGESELEPVSPQVIACNFWLLSADPSSPFAAQGWYQADGARRPVADKIRAWQQSRPKSETLLDMDPADRRNGKVINHYLLLPGFEWGVSDWYLEIIRPYVKKHLPTIGFSPEEAELAARVTVVGSLSSYPEDLLSHLQNAGCQVEQISGDGMDIATQLAER